MFSLFAPHSNSIFWASDCKWKRLRNGNHLTEPQNHRMLGDGRDLCESSSPTSLPKQGHIQQAAQDRVQVGLEYVQRRRFHNLPGQPVPVLRHPQRGKKLKQYNGRVEIFIDMLQLKCKKTLSKI